MNGSGAPLTCNDTGDGRALTDADMRGAGFHRDGRTVIRPGWHGGAGAGDGRIPAKGAEAPEAIVAIAAGGSDVEMVGAIALAIERGQPFFLDPGGRKSGEVAATQGRKLEVSAGLVGLDSFACPVFGVLSGGTTGTPKRILRSQASWMESFRYHGQRWGLSHRDTYGILGAVAHSWALYGVLEGLHFGADLQLMAALGPRQQVDRIRMGTITVLNATPAQLRRLVRATDRPMTSAIRLIAVCGARLEPALAAATRETFPGANLVEFYGTSETSFISVRVVGACPGARAGTPYPGVALRISGAAGEIRVRSPLLALGEIVDGHDGGEKRFPTPAVRLLATDRDGFLATGECGHLDEAGHLVVEGRLDRRYTVADMNVDPEAIETLLMDMDGVRAACVYPVADLARGSVSHADVLIGTGDDATRIQAACRRELGSLIAPRRYRIFTDARQYRQAGHAHPGPKS